MSEEKKVLDQEQEIKELNDEGKAVIREAAIAIIKSMLKEEYYNAFLCSISVNANKETKEYDTATITVFNAPASLSSFVGVHSYMLDIKEGQLIGEVNFTAPVVLQSDKDGNAVDAVIVNSRIGNISVTTANLVSEMMADVDAANEDDEEAAPEEAEKVEGEVVE